MKKISWYIFIAVKIICIIVISVTAIRIIMDVSKIPVSAFGILFLLVVHIWDVFLFSLSILILLIIAAINNYLN